MNDAASSTAKADGLSTNTTHTLPVSSAALAARGTLVPRSSVRGNWHTALARETRSEGQGLYVSQSTDRIAPTLRDAKWPDLNPRYAKSPSDPEASDPVSMAVLTAEQAGIVEDIKAARSSVPVGIFVLWNAKKGGVYGWAYNGKTKADPTAYDKGMTRAKDKQRYAEKIVWEELKFEGQTSAINAYDGAMLTWGRGFAFGSRNNNQLYMDSLPAIMTRVMADADIADAFYAYGISYNRTDRFVVVNTVTGTVETDWNALALIQATPALLGVFVMIAEDDRYAQAVTDAQWQSMLKGSANVPGYALDWSEPLIALVAHLHHQGSAYGWSNYSGCSSIDDILMTLGRRKGELLNCGAYKSQGFWLINRFQNWGGGVAWQAIAGVTPYSREYPSTKLNDPGAVDDFQGVVLFPDPNKTNSYFPFWWIPGEDPVSRDETYEYIASIHASEMGQLITTLKAKTKSELTYLQNNYSRKCWNDFGGRPKLVIDAMLMLKSPARPHKDRIAFLIDDDTFNKLPYDQQVTLKNAMGLGSVDLELHRLKKKDYHGYLGAVQGRSMPHLLDTLEGHKRSLNEIKTHYETCCVNRFGDRPGVAIEAVALKKESEAVKRSFLTNHTGLHALPDPQQEAVWTYLGIPWRNESVDPELAKLQAGDYHGYISTVHAREMSSLLRTLDSHRAFLFEIYSHYASCCVNYYGGRPGVAIEAVEHYYESEETRLGFVRGSSVMSLPLDQRNAIRRYLQLEDEPVVVVPADPDLAKWESGDRHGYIATIQGRSMSHLLNTLLKHSKYIYDIEAYYVDAEYGYFGPRPLVAMEAVEQKWASEASKQSFVSSHSELLNLPDDQQTAVRNFLGV